MYSSGRLDMHSLKEEEQKLSLQEMPEPPMACRKDHHSKTEKLRENVLTKC